MANLLIFSSEIVQSCLDATGLWSVEVGDMNDLHATSSRCLDVPKIASE